jgi:type II secretory pathway component PulF
MPSFSYAARDRAGAATSGQLDAPTRRDALRSLAARGLNVVSLSELASGPGSTAKGAKPDKAAPAKAPSKSRSPQGSSRPASGEKVSLFHHKSATARPTKAHRLPFLQSLLDLTSSGLSTGEAIRLLSVRLKEPALRALCQGLWEQISEGAPLSRAMAAYPHIFDTSTINLIAAGEATGSINDTLGRLIDHLTEQQALRGQIISALAYPVFMFFVASGVILFFLFYLLPKMQNLLSSLGGKLPASTQLLIGVSNFVLHYGVFILVAGILAAISFWRWRKTEAGRRSIDTWTLQLPLLGNLASSRTVLAVTQTLGILLENGITTSEALKMTERQITNVIHREAFAEASSRVLEGEALSAALGRTRCFPDLILDRLSVGENTGNIVPSLKDIARTYQKRISLQLGAGTRVLTTIFMLGVFAFVAFIAFAIVSAVFSMSSSFKVGG